MIQQPDSTQDVTTTVRDLVVFALSVPFMGAPSMSLQQLVKWVEGIWDGLSEAEKKNGRAVMDRTMFHTEVQQWWLPREKASYMGTTPVLLQLHYTSVQETADGTFWCDYRTGALPQVSV